MLSKDIKKIIDGLYSVLILEDIISHRLRRLILKIFGYVIFITSLFLFFVGNPYYEKIKGLLFILISFSFFFLNLEFYFYSFYERSKRNPKSVHFELAKILFYSKSDDLVKGFIFSDLGFKTMQRLGFNEDELKSYLISKEYMSSDIPSSSLESLKDFKSYINFIFESNSSFSDFLFKKSIKEEELLGAFLWVMEMEEEKVNKEMWWREDNLMRIPGIAKNWAYGETYMLDKYGYDATESPTSRSEIYASTFQKKIKELESIISKKSNANCIIVSDNESAKLDIVHILSERIREGVVLQKLSHDRVYIINSELIIENGENKISFERELTSLLSEAIRAKNIILVIPDYFSFIKSAKALSSDITSFLKPYFESSYLHVIGLSSKDEFEQNITLNGKASENFEILKVEEEGGEGILLMLQEEALALENELRVFFTYGALLSIKDDVKRYFSTLNYFEKAKDILEDTAIFCREKRIKIILKEHVLALIESKTGIPTSVPKGEEKELLLNLPEILHKKIIGQDEAVNAISFAIKRSRAGILNKEKPIGSFLFLGPTGVGKTETTKALAEVFFKSSDSISRLDMSEFSDGESLQRLLGTFESSKPGILSTLIREKPYGVLLLDEFEKTNKEVMNLFLQILDEGVFSDSKGKKVNARNNIIIATSNAGSEIIWNIVKGGDSLKEEKEKIIDSIIKEGIFKPELLNRFDGVILFNPLEDKDLLKIARLMMEKFAKTMLEKGIKIEINDTVLSYLLKKGTDPKFGARPMRRAIQDEIENLFAEKLIEGDLKEGQTATFELDSDGMVQIRVR